ncbi:MAG TPA: hypothetical protein VMB34_18205 [Acetobacteraceae bacterium]|nr:hypothetical protein [Acetobacteraceae bacterium]
MTEQILPKNKFTPLPGLWILLAFCCVWAFDVGDGTDDFLLIPVYLTAHLAVGAGVLVVLVRAMMFAARKQWRRAASFSLAIPSAVVALRILAWAGLSPMSLYLWYGGYRAEAPHSPPPPGETKRLVTWRWGEIGGMGATTTYTILVYDESDELQQTPDPLRENPREYSGRVRRLVGTGTIQSIIPEGGHFYLVRYLPE